MWLFSLALAVFNPTCTRTEVTQKKPLLAVLEDVSGSFSENKEPIPSGLTDLFDTVHLTFGDAQSTSLDRIAASLRVRSEGRPIAAVWAHTDGALTQGMGWSEMHSMMNRPVFFASIPRDSILKNGWEWVGVDFPREVLVGDTQEGLLRFVHRGTTQSPSNFELFWGDERVARTVLPAESGTLDRSVSFVWKPQTSGQRAFRSPGHGWNKNVRVREDRPKLVVFGKPVHPDVAYFVSELTRSKTATVYYRESQAQESDLNAAIWIIAGNQPQAGEGRFKGSKIILPEERFLIPSSSGPRWPGEAYGLPDHPRWMRVSAPKGPEWGASSTVWEVGYTGFAAAARLCDSSQSHLPTAWVDRLWSSNSGQTLTLRFDEPRWAGVPVTVEALWDGWTPESGATYPKVELRWKEAKKSVYFLPKEGALNASIEVSQPGLYSFEAVGTYAGVKRTARGQWEFQSPRAENQPIYGYSVLRALALQSQGGWCWLDESDQAVDRLREDERFQPYLQEQKKSRRWRDFWVAFVLMAIPLGVEALLRKRWFGRA